MLDFMRRFRYEILRWLKDRLDTVEDPVDRIKLQDFIQEFESHLENYAIRI